ncbi:hypothetical protein [Methylobacterium sp. CM6246]
MAIHHPTPPFGGGERPRLPSAQVGPVTQAIRAMRRPTWPLHGVRQLGDDLPQGIRALSRAEVENLVGGLIDLLDGWDGDADHEPDLDREPEALEASATEWTGHGAHRFNVGRAA